MNYINYDMGFGYEDDGIKEYNYDIYKGNLKDLKKINSYNGIKNDDIFFSKLIYFLTESELVVNTILEIMASLNIEQLKKITWIICKRI